MQVPIVQRTGALVAWSLGSFQQEPADDRTCMRQASMSKDGRGMRRTQPPPPPPELTPYPKQGTLAAQACTHAPVRRQPCPPKRGPRPPGGECGPPHSPPAEESTHARGCSAARCAALPRVGRSRSHAASQVRTRGLARRHRCRVRHLRRRVLRARPLPPPPRPSPSAGSSQCRSGMA
eukprot:349995-Chlamydomonas_euryale.AAC.1